MCRVLGLSTSGYYAWLKRPPSARARRDAELRVQVRKSWQASRWTLRIEGASRRRRKAVTTVQNADARPPPHLVDRNFHTEVPDLLWVADITHVRTDAGWLYLAGRRGRLEPQGCGLGVDHAGHFGQHSGPEDKRTRTIIGTALEKLGVEVILTNSPQAKGRVERTFGTAQDRLVNRMRLARITTLEEANRYLEEQWIPSGTNASLWRPPTPLDAHRPLPPDTDLQGDAPFDDDPGGDAGRLGVGGRDLPEAVLEAHGEVVGHGLQVGLGEE